MAGQGERLAAWLPREAGLALRREAGLTPKPGLVDREGPGAHKDMDHPLMLTSADAIEPYFSLFYRHGFDSCRIPPASAMRGARELGKRAEAAMFSATGGVNTHKGAIFLMGLALVAAGRCAGLGGEEGISVPTVCQRAAALSAGLCARELGHEAGTKGQRAYLAHGARGARGEAESGFESVRMVGLPALHRALAGGAGEDAALLLALLALIAGVEDTNALTRAGPEKAQNACLAAGALHGQWPMPHDEFFSRLRQLDRAFQKDNISHGGCADLLALTWLFHRLGHRRERT